MRVRCRHFARAHTDETSGRRGAGSRRESARVRNLGGAWPANGRGGARGANRVTRRLSGASTLSAMGAPGARHDPPV